MTALAHTKEHVEAAVRRSGAAAITARGLSKSFGERQVITGLDLHIPAGQFLAVVGRSGCGKSTLLRLLAGLETPDVGTLRLGNGVTPSNVRLMFQEPRLLPWARVAGNVAVGLDNTGSKRERRERSMAALADVGLADRADVWPSILSGGQKQRVALARALVSGPAVLALDEPLGALDALTRIEMQRLIQRVTLDQGCTVLLVTHDVTEAVALADRVVVLEEGRIALDVNVPLPRPRQRGGVESAAIEARILARILEQDVK